jgi:pimeloyl-ACP methyl ester carboxylesterase
MHELLATTRDHPMQSEYITWRGHRIFVTVTGEGDPLLLVPGLGNNIGMWVPLMEQFQDRRIIRLDAPGTGLSSTPLFPISVPELADLLVAVLDERGAPWADVLGFSYGGAVAQQLAFDHSTRVRRLVLAATNCGIGAVPGWLPAVTGLATPIRYYSPSFFNRTAAATFGGVTARDESVRQRMINARRSHPPAADGYALQLLGIFGWSSWNFLRCIPHETLVISGDDDPLVPVANARMLADRIPNATLEIVPGAGHLLLWDDAENLGPRISRFLNRATTRRTPGRARPARTRRHRDARRVRLQADL